IFLLITQSKLLLEIPEHMDKQNLLIWDLLYLLGYCLIAGFSSRAFMESVSANILRRTQEEQKKLKAEQNQLKEGQQQLRAAQDGLKEGQKALKEEQDTQKDLAAEVYEAIDSPPKPKAAFTAPQPESEEGKNIALAVARLSETDKRVLTALA